MTAQRRRWFQFSLTTCILLMAVAGVLVWANIKSNVQLTEDFSILVNQVQGWPWPYREELGLGEDYGPGGSLEFLRSTIGTKIGIEYRYFDQIEALKSGTYTHFDHAIQNGVVALTILILTAFLSEYLIRRRCRSKQEENA